MKSPENIGPEALQSGEQELWFVIYDPVTGIISDHGNAFGRAEYDAETGRYANPSLRVPERLLSVTDIRVDPRTLEIVPVEPDVAQVSPDQQILDALPWKSPRRSR
ncbi:hypothetical protein [Rhizobium sp. 9140]|uniref:hypothetical protein n=1 Tax=Rhizobium sp. 9140 TaxID=1761900 RepID=UPI0007999B77|nr:hypothetical protein [Rhizobium sp. 9140]CZT32986.1 hypothetical protein GA0004734_00000140 [Rhizobium sp. 9140]